MFVQVIRGRVADPAGFRAGMERWRDELLPGARGFLGGTSGVSPDGDAVIVARFESAGAARANSDRPEQGEWWAALSRTLDGDAGFAETDDVDVLVGICDDSRAGFAQLMDIRTDDGERVRALLPRLEAAIRETRPDVAGGVVAWLGPDRAVQLVWFTSEEQARAGESEKPGGDAAAVFAELDTLTTDTAYVDLPEPLTFSP